MRTFALVASAIALLAACGGQEIDPGHTTTTSGDTTGTTTTSTTTGDGGAGGAGTGTGGAGMGGQPAGLADVELIYKDTSTKVDVAKLPTQPYKGAEVVPLSVVWSAGALTPDLTGLAFDFEGDDGFHPSMKPNCMEYPKAADIAKGYILPETRTLVWDDTLGYPGCYSVKLVAKMIGLDAP